MSNGRFLLVVSVDAEAAALRDGAGDDARDVEVLVAGVGPLAAAAATAARLAREPRVEVAVSCGVGGGWAGRADLGDVVVAEQVVAADVGAQDPQSPHADRTALLSDLGLGPSSWRCPPERVEAVVRALDADGRVAVHRGTVLTVATATGTQARADALAARHAPHAEAMEGAGVAVAAAAAGVDVLEVRAVSNAVGPRDRGAWHLDVALDALRSAAAPLVAALREDRA